MKKSLKLSALVTMLLLLVGFTACSSEEDAVNKNGTTTQYAWGQEGTIKTCSHLLFTNGKEDVNGKEIGNGDQEFIFKGKQTLKKGVYLLKGWVYIADGAELTIEPGTIIKGDKTTKATLIAERGGKLIAKGNVEQPIVFTSAQTKGNRKPGDWGGIILCGKAVNNQKEMQIEGGPRTKHGGTDNADNSGILSYVRIEFAGYPFMRDKEINALTLGSVGSGTQLDHIQVSYTNDDSFEWFGGTVNAQYLIAYKGWDDDFDTDNGYSGKVQFGLVVRDSKIADISQSNGFESDNNASGSAVEPYTTAQFSNITFIGPKLDPQFKNTPDYITGGIMNPNNGSALGKYQSVMQIRRNSRLSCFNSLAIGYPIGIMLDNEKGDTQGAANTGKIKLKNIWFAAMDMVGSDMNKKYEDVLVTNYKTKTADKSKKSFSTSFFLAQGNKVKSSWQGLINTLTFKPLSTSPLLSAASFNGLIGFQQVSYIGAFSENDDWADGWTEFNPQNADY